MKNTKKIIAVALASVLSMSVFAGCGSSSGTSSSGKKDVVTVWTFPHYVADKKLGTRGYEDLLKDQIAQYKKTHPNVEVKYEMLSWDDGDQKFDVALNAGTPPDIFFSISNPKFVKTGLVIPLDQYLTADEKKDYVPFAINRYNINGKQYGLPLWIGMYCWGGNKDYFEQAGIDYKKIQQQGWTWDEFKADAQKMTKTVNGKKVYGFVTQGKDDETFKHFMFSNGVTMMMNKDGKFQYTPDKVTQTLDYMKSLMDAGIMPKETAGIDDTKEGDMFNNGQAAVFGRIGPYQVNFNNNRNKSIDEGKTKGEKKNLILLPFPHSNDAEEAVTGGCGGYMAFRQKQDKGKDHEKNVVDLMKILAGTDAGEACAAVGCTPATYTGAEKYKDKFGFDEDNQNYVTRALKILKPTDLLTPEQTANQDKIEKEAITPLFQAFLAGEKTSKDVANGIADKAKEVLGQ